MKDLSRRDLLRASAGAAMVAVPMAVLAGPAARAAAPDVDDELESDALSTSGPVMFCVHDAARGEVSILHGSSEVVVTDRRLVAQIMKAANVRQNGEG
jgi:hypothetical protein